MSVINFHSKEISVKVVYYGPGLCGKTTSLHTVYASLPADKRPQIVSLATEVDRTIFFDFLPVTAYRIRDFTIRLQLYTVPGQVFYNATRKLVLTGVDGIVFVADSQLSMRDSTLESLHNLNENLADLGLDPEQVPTVLQFNKRDVHDVFSVEQMNELYNPRRLSVFPTVATTGQGLFEALRAVTQLMVNNLVRKGLGRQLTPPDQADVAPGPLSATLGAAAEAASQDAGTPGNVEQGGWWPAESDLALTTAMDDAVVRGAWPDAVHAAHAHLQKVAKNWAVATGETAANPLPTFLLMRGLSAARYRALLEALADMDGARPVLRAAGMNAVVLALEAVW